MLNVFRFTLFLVALLGLSLPALAQPKTTLAVQITEGTIDLDRHLGNGLGGEVNLLLDNIMVSGTMFNFAVTPDCNHLGAVCLRGTEVRLPATHITEDGFNVGSVRIDGQTIEQVYYLGGFNFNSPAITIPRASAITGTISVTAPFAVSGDLLGCRVPMPSANCSPSDTIFSRAFVGSGKVTYRLRAIKGLDFAGTIARYSYDLVSVKFLFEN